VSDPASTSALADVLYFDQREIAIGRHPQDGSLQGMTRKAKRLCDALAEHGYAIVPVDDVAKARTLDDVREGLSEAILIAADLANRGIHDTYVAVADSIDDGVKEHRKILGPAATASSPPSTSTSDDSPESTESAAETDQ
jgi:hypothetical protein